MSTLQENRRPELPAAAPTSEHKQRRQMLAALALLLVALILVLFKDRQFWFPDSTTAQSDSDQTDSEPAASHVAQSSTQPATSPRPKAKSTPPPVQNIPSDQPAPGAVITASNRAVLPPLEVEVVAGDQHRTVQPGNPAIKIELQPRSSTPAPPSSDAASATNATAQVHLSPGTVQVVSHPVDPSYPLLAKQMKVQGSVVLQALIGKEGNIQDLQVLSGPTILSAAAREAVKQWRFKPYLQSGQPVETEARITVNFTISTQ
jgi:protein TonB